MLKPESQCDHLAVELRRVMALEEHLQQLLVGYLSRVERHLRERTATIAA